MAIPSGYTSAQVVQAVPTGINSALVLISTTTIGTTVSSVTVSGAFSATYENYKIVVSGGAGSTSENILMKLGSSVTDYYYGGKGRTYAGADVNTNATNGTEWIVGSIETNGLTTNIELSGPFLAQRTFFSANRGSIATGGNSMFIAGFHNSAVSYSSFILSSGATMTGGTIRVYGYTNS